MVVKDASEQELLDLLDRVKRAMMIVSPKGAQGFILVLGSQQISPQVLAQCRDQELDRCGHVVQA
jgi:predicted polyphosphate/ATP-dependent NAD kinase